LPIGVGFGIRDARQRRGSVADAVVIGSRIIQEIENTEGQWPQASRHALRRRSSEPRARQACRQLGVGFGIRDPLRR
jgi:tryptophan synthase alpha subunit